MRKRRIALLALLFTALLTVLPRIEAQAVTVTWPLTANQTSFSSASTLATGANEIVSGGTAPTVSIFDYWNGHAQRLNAGSSGWTAGPMNPTRFLQFDVVPAAGHSFTATNVYFNYGAANVANQIKSDVAWSTDNWMTSHTLATGLSYPPIATASYNSAVSAPSVPPGGRFSVRIYPYAVINSTAMAPTFASHNAVVITGNSAIASIGNVRFQVVKSTGSTTVPGNYTFNLTCSGPGGPYTGPNPITVTLPGNPVLTQVPQNDTCTLSETPIAGWNIPTFGGSSAQIVPNGWNAQIGPMSVNTSVTVTNNPGVINVPHVRLAITKSTGANVVPGNYTFHIACTGPNGPYTGPNPVTVALPGSPDIEQIPQGDTCTLSETPIAGWGTPTWGGSNAAITPNGWNAQIGPMNVNSTLTVTNSPPAASNVNFQISKQFVGPVVPGTYTFHFSCTGAYTGPSTFNLTVPPSPSSLAVTIPVGSTCTLSEDQHAGWNTPLFGSSGQTLSPNGWSVTIGPFHPTNTMADRVVVTNRP